MSDPQIKVIGKKLRPTVPSYNPRYHRIAGGMSSPLLPSGLYAGSLGLSEWDGTRSKTEKNWQSFIHPEGKPCFNRRSRCSVTGSTTPNVTCELRGIWQALPLKMASYCEEYKEGWPEDTEVCLDLNGLGTCDCYISAQYHAAFWLSKAPEELDLPAVDRNTPPCSTSHLPSEECHHYLSLIESTPAFSSASPTLWLLGRLITTMTGHKNHSRFGQEGVRLDHSQLGERLHIPLALSLLFDAHVESEAAIRATAVNTIFPPPPWNTLVDTNQVEWTETPAMTLFLILKMHSGRVMTATAISAALELDHSDFFHLCQPHARVYNNNIASQYPPSPIHIAREPSTVSFSNGASVSSAPQESAPGIQHPPVEQTTNSNGGGERDGGARNSRDPTSPTTPREHLHRLRRTYVVLETSIIAIGCMVMATVSPTGSIDRPRLLVIAIYAAGASLVSSLFTGGIIFMMPATEAPWMYHFLHCSVVTQMLLAGLALLFLLTAYPLAEVTGISSEKEQMFIFAGFAAYTVAPLLVLLYRLPVYYDNMLRPRVFVDEEQQVGLSQTEIN